MTFTLYLARTLPETQKQWDIFKGQMTPAIKAELETKGIELVPVPSNMMHFFQPLDLTVDESVKKFMRKMFITYYSCEVKNQLENDTALDDIEDDLRLSKIKPLHAQWLVEMYNHLGQQILINGWMKAGVVDLFVGSHTPPPEDPFESIYR